MKKILIFILFPQFLFSQNWVDKMQDPSQNFYEVQDFATVSKPSIK